MLQRVEAAGIKVRWLTRELCQQDKCRASEDGVFLYLDRGHLSIEGSGWIGAHTPALRFAAEPP